MHATATKLFGNTGICQLPQFCSLLKPSRHHDVLFLSLFLCPQKLTHDKPTSCLTLSYHYGLPATHYKMEWIHVLGVHTQLSLLLRLLTPCVKC